MNRRYAELIRNGVPMHQADAARVLWKNNSNSQVQETQKTNVTTNTSNVTDNAALTVDAPESKQTGVIKLSNVESGAAVNLSVNNTGLSGGDIEEIIAPAGQLLKSISSDIARSSSASSAISASVSDALDTAQGTVDSVIKGVSETAQDLAGKAKDVLKNPGVQLAAGGAILLLINAKRKKS